MSNPTTFHVTFSASVTAEYANYGTSGYKIGEITFRSMNTFEAGMQTAFSKSLGDGRFLTAQVRYNANGSEHIALVTAENFDAAMEAIDAEINDYHEVTLDELLEEV